MPFCNYCGRELRDGDKFCVSCGHAVASMTPDKTQESFIHKCPNCGEPLPEFAIRCASCGFELRDIQKKSAVTIFLEKLNTLGGSLDGAKRKARAIREFSVPNTRDETIEFLAHALACVDTRLISKANPTKAEMTRFEYKAQSVLTDAWIEKFNEVYKRAEKEYNNDPAFQRIKNITEHKHHELKKAKKAKKRENGVIHNGCFLFLAASLIVMVFIIIIILIIWAIIK